MTRIPAAILERVHQLAAELPSAELSKLVTSLTTAPPGQWEAIRREAQDVFPGGSARDLVGRLIGDWSVQAPTITPAELGIMLTTALHGVTAARRQTLELVWTGPSSPSPLRRTEQALLQLIDEAAHDVLIVAYAVYRVPDVQAALLRAAEREVQITIVIESPDQAEGQKAYSNFMALGTDLPQLARVYFWPRNKRPTAANGHVALLHVKCAVADSRAMFISSANLTEYALTRNMELGLLVQNGPVPARVAAHFQQLISNGTLIAAVQQV